MKLGMICIKFYEKNEKEKT